MALAGIRQAVDRAVHAAARPGRAEGIASPELAAEGFKKKLWPFGWGQAVTFDIDIFQESPASHITPGSDFYDWTFLARDIFRVSDCLSRGSKEEKTPGQSYPGFQHLRQTRSPFGNGRSTQSTRGSVCARFRMSV